MSDVIEIVLLMNSLVIVGAILLGLYAILRALSVLVEMVKMSSLFGGIVGRGIVACGIVILSIAIASDAVSGFIGRAMRCAWPWFATVTMPLWVPVNILAMITGSFAWTLLDRGEEE